MTRKTTLSLVAAALLSTLLTACGGGGGSGDNNSLDDIGHTLDKAVTTVNIEKGSLSCDGNGAKVDTTDGFGICVAPAGTTDLTLKTIAVVTNVDADDLKWEWKPQDASITAQAPTFDKLTSSVQLSLPKNLAAGDYKIDVHVEGKNGKSGDTTYTIKLK
ncbi:hypothetical protein ACFONG_09500 [Uliginosibacterium paludis]|uniref:Uncharacterized protein n=1 Tax=Uliginosibacterium paludis TaxID=1615952 RepID=A0ABV2CN08_9RHOO